TQLERARPIPSVIVSLSQASRLPMLSPARLTPPFIAALMPRSPPLARFPISKATRLPDTQSIRPQADRYSSASSLIPVMRISELRRAIPLVPQVAAAEHQPPFILLRR